MQRALDDVLHDSNLSWILSFHKTIHPRFCKLLILFSFFRSEVEIVAKEIIWNWQLKAHDYYRLLCLYKWWSKAGDVKGWGRGRAGDEEEGGWGRCSGQWKIWAKFGMKKSGGVGLGWNRERVGKGKDEARKLSLFWMLQDIHQFSLKFYC